MSHSTALSRLVFLAVSCLVTVGVATPRSAQAEAPPQYVSLQLRQSAQGIEAVLTWTGVTDTSASYVVYRRQTRDVSYQTPIDYATVPASARNANGTFEFVDTQPTSQADHPCYSVGAQVGEGPPQSASPDVCLPTLPGAAMGRLTFAANPGPDANSWYLTGTNFAPGSDVAFKEGASAQAACTAGESIADPVQATLDGFVVAFVQLPGAEGPRTIAACQPGWLPEQLAQPRVVTLPASQPAVALGYPLTTTTGIAEVDRVIEAIRTGPATMLALLHPHSATNQFGATVVGVPAWQCLEFVSSDSLDQQASEAMPSSSLLYAVYRVDPATAPWQLFKGADYAIVLAYPGVAGPRGAVAAVSSDGIVGFAWSCASVPPFFVRGNAGFVLGPPTKALAAPPGAPATGTGFESAGLPGRLPWPALGWTLTLSGLLLAACRFAVRRQR